MAKPDKIPYWAREDETDDVSGQPNVAEPTEGKKDSGWEREELPPRQWLNWLQRLTGEWIAWFDEQVTDLIENAAFVDEQNTFIGGQTVAGQLATQSLLVNGNPISGGAGAINMPLSGFVAPGITASPSYRVANGVVTITFPSEISGVAGGSNANSLSWGASPTTGLPAAIRPQSTRRAIIPLIRGGARDRIGMVTISSGGSGTFQLMAVNESPFPNNVSQVLSGWQAGETKGIPAGTTFSYSIAD